MNKTVTLPITEARRKIFDIVDEAQETGTRFMLTTKGTPKAIVMSVAEFESWAETLEIMEDFPSLGKDIKEAEADLARGNYIALEEVLAEEGFVLADKSKKGYVSSSTGRKGQESPKKD